MGELSTVPARERRQHNLPAQLTSFVGREADLDAATRLLAGVRLLTLTGPGGTGKTRLALQLADRVLDQYPDGACFVPLASIANADLVLTVALEALRLPDARDRPPIEILKDVLHAKQMLLVFDNFEHVLEAGPRLTELLAACPSLTILVTSRIPLRVSGEQEILIAPLALPVHGRRSASAAGLLPAVLASEAVRLFVERARAVAPAFGLAEANAGAVAELCWRLDGLPLAIELAAARTRLLTPEEMVARLSRAALQTSDAPLNAGDQPPSAGLPGDPGRISPLRFLSAGARDVPARHRTLRDTIAWSYDLLTPNEQALFRRLAVFVGGWTLDAAEAVGAAEVGDRRWALAPDEVLDGVESLIAKSLLRRVEGAAGVRVTMLETIREYGLEQLEGQGELLTLRRWHVRYFLALAERAEPDLRGSEQVAWLNRLEAEHDNMRAALEWGLADSLDTDAALRLAGSLSWFWVSRGHISEGRRWLDRALVRPGESPPARLKALYGIGWLAHFQRDRGVADRYLGEALSLARALDDVWSTAWTLHILGRAAYFQGDSVGAKSRGEESLVVAQAIGDAWLIAWGLHLLGLAAHIAADYARARSHYEASLVLRRQLGCSDGIGLCLSLLSMLAIVEGDNARALQLGREGLIAVRQAFRITVHNVMSNFAALAARFGQPWRAVRLAGAGARIGTTIAVALIPISQRMLDEALAVARRELDGDAYARAWREGQLLSLDEAIAEALAVDAPPAGRPDPAAASAAPRPRGSLDLTEREIEVLRLIVAGRTTREIARALAVSSTTVERHITHLYGKTGARGRADATVYALEHGIAPASD
jgi:non-specific serine/threonine protein kinase